MKERRTLCPCPCPALPIPPSRIDSRRVSVLGRLGVVLLVVVDVWGRM